MLSKVPEFREQDDGKRGRVMLLDKLFHANERERCPLHISNSRCQLSMEARDENFHPHLEEGNFNGECWK